MELVLDNGKATYQIQGYENQSIIVNNHTYVCPILIMPDLLIAPWGSPSLTVEVVEWDHFSILLSLKPQVLLIGTGIQQHFLNPLLTKKMREHKIGLEVMNTAAACRTYTLLMAEGRNIAACLFC